MSKCKNKGKNKHQGKNNDIKADDLAKAVKTYREDDSSTETGDAFEIIGSAPQGAGENNSDPDATIREDILAFAQDATNVKGNRDYGDPLDNFTAAAVLKSIFWGFFSDSESDLISDREELLGRDSAHGHAIDMILTKLARIATCPTKNIVEDCYVDGAAYFALAREMAVRTAEIGVE